MPQRIPARSLARFRPIHRQPRVELTGAWSRGPVLVLLALVLGPFSAPLRAQSRSDLQVAAQVVSAQPSQLALAQGLASASGARAPEIQFLASVQVARLAEKREREEAVRRPKAVVTISFLHN